MRKIVKVLVGIATLWPLLYLVLFMLTILGSVFRTFAVPFTILVPLHLLTMVWLMGLTAFYIVNLMKNERLDRDKKILWAVLLFMGNMVTMPVYWYLCIWREDQNVLSNSKGQEAPHIPHEPHPNWRNETNNIAK